MLNKINRLTKDKDFNNVFQKGASHFNQITGVKARGNKLGYSRFGILVGAKVSKKAMVRNKIKRQIRETIRTNLREIKSGYDYIIISLPPIVGKSYQEIEQSIKDNIRRLNRKKC